MITFTVTQADTFQALRGNASWAALTPAVKSAALYKASDYISAIYVIDGLETTDPVSTACLMLAAEMVAKPLSVAAPSQAVLSEEMGAGNNAYTEKKTYAAPSGDPYTLITAILAPIPRRVDAAAREASQPAPATLTTLRLRRA
jgi:hypothetical protein